MPWLLGLGVFAVYVATLFPTVPPGDSGELIVQAYHLGVPHPPGYPLYTLLAKLFTLLPFGSVAWRVNLFSAVCGTVAVMLLFSAIRRWTKNLGGALAAAGLFAFSPLFWRHCIVAEVFALNHLFISLLFYLSVRFYEEKEIKFAYWSFFVMGLALTNHQTILFYEVPMVLGFLILDGKRIIKKWFVLILLFLAGLLPYVYLFVAGARHVPGSWGNTGTLAGFLTHVLRKEYGTFQLEAGSENSISLAQYLGAFSSKLFSECLFVGPLIALIGVGRLRQRALAVLWGGAFLFYLIAFHTMANIAPSEGVPLAILSRFWTQSTFVVFAFIGLGVAAFRRFSLPLAIGLVAVQVGVNYHNLDNHRNFTFENLGHALIDPLPKDSILILSGNEMLGSVLYLRECEKIRQDVSVLDLHLLSALWYRKYVESVFGDVKVPAEFYFPRHPSGYDLKSFFDANLSEHSIFLSYLPSDTLEASDSSADESYVIWPYGLVNEVTRKGEPFNPNELLERTDGIYSRFDVERAKSFAQEAWVSHLLNFLRETKFQRSLALIQRGFQHDEAILQSGVQSLKKLISEDPHPDPKWQTILGQISR